MKPNKISTYGKKKIKEIGTYEVKYSKQLRGQESEALSYNLLKNPKTMGAFLLFFFFFLFVKKNKMPDLVSNGREEKGEGEEAGWGVGHGQ